VCEGQSELLMETQLGSGKGLECVGKFCYLGDTIGAGNGPKEKSRVRVKSAWVQFRELAPILTFRIASLEVKGKVYKACEPCVQRVMDSS